MTRFPSMPLFCDTFFAKTADISDDASHAYLFLLMHAWIRGGGIPDDDNRLARMARMGIKRWRSVKAEVMPYWALYDGTWRNKRLDEELEFVSRRASQNKINGNLGGRPKLINLRKNNDEKNPTGLFPQTQINPPTPTPTYKERKIPKERKTGVLEILMVGAGLTEQTAKDVVEHRKALKKPLTSRAAQMLATELFDWGDGEQAAATMIRQSWRGFKPEWATNLGMKRPMNGHAHPSGAASGLYFAKRDTPQWVAWQAWWKANKGASMPGNDGWHVQGEWPPK